MLYAHIEAEETIASINQRMKQLAKQASRRDINITCERLAEIRQELKHLRIRKRRLKLAI